MECLESITKLYNDIVDYFAALYSTLPLGTGEVFHRKNSSEISSKMEHIKAHNLPSIQTSKQNQINLISHLLGQRTTFGKIKMTL